MTFRSSNAPSLDDAYTSIRAMAASVSALSTALNNAPSITRRAALDYANQLADYLARFNTMTSLSGLAAYARSQENDVNYDVIAEFNTMKAQLVATQDWIVANFPATTGELRVYTFDVNKRYADINLTAPQLSSFKAQLTLLIGTIS